MKRLVAPLVLLALIVLGTVARVQTVLRHPDFDAHEPVGMLQSDPALLYYLTERVVDAGGGVPRDWGAEPRIAYPETLDVPARYTVGLEWLVTWVHFALDRRLPLHVVCLWVSAALASLTVLGVYLLARELTASAGWAGCAAVLWAVLPANYRTLGFVLVREDLSLPLFALHLGLAARAARTRGLVSGTLAGLMLGGALATWHAGTTFATLELATLFALALAGRGNPLAHAAGRAALGGYALVALAVPALFAKGAVLGPPIQLALAMWALAAASARGVRAPWRAALAALALSFTASVGLGHLLGTGGDLGHVVALAWAKLSNVGWKPADPRHLPFEVRMMWQGPFDTTGLSTVGTAFGFVLLAVPVLLFLAFLDARSADADPRARAAGLSLLPFGLAAWWIVRALVVPGLLVPALTARALQRAGTGERALAPALGAVALIALQAVAFGGWLGGNELPWHSPARRDALRAMVAAVREHVPAGEAVAADFMVSPALLAHDRCPVVLQPKWESADARGRVEEFWRTFYHETPDALRRLLVGRWRTRYLLLDPFMLGQLRASLYLAGLPGGALVPGSAAQVLLSGEDAPGFTVLDRAPTHVLLRIDG